MDNMDDDTVQVKSLTKKDMKDRAQQWVDNGFEHCLLPLKSSEKAPSINKWTKAVSQKAEIFDAVSRGLNLGLQTANTPAFDIEDSPYADDILKVLQDIFPTAPIRYRPGSKSRAMLVRGFNPIDDEPVWKSGSISEDNGTANGKKIFELLGAGRQLMIEGRHPSGTIVEWTKRVHLDELPEVTYWDLCDAFAAVQSMLEIKGVHLRAAISKGGSVTNAQETGDTCDDETTTKLLKLIPNDDAFADRDKWVELAHATYGASNGSDEARDAFIDWSHQQPQHPDDAPERLWDTIRPENVRLGAAYLFDQARKHNPVEVAKLEFDKVPFEQIEKDREDKLKLNWELVLKRLRTAREEPGHKEALMGVDSITGKGGQFIKMDWQAVSGKPTVPPHISDWHTRGQSQLLVADPFQGKSTLMLLWALAIVLERKDLVGDSKIDWPGAVVFISNEDGAQVIGAKLQAFIHDLQIEEEDFKHGLYVWSNRLPLVAKVGNAIAPTSAAVDMVQKLAELRAKESIALLVIDTFASANDGGDENSVGDMQAVLNAANDIAKAGFTAVSLIHHKNKGGKTRGSSAIPGSVRLLAELDACSPETEMGWSEQDCKKRVKFWVPFANNRAAAGSRYFEFKTINLVATDPRDPAGVSSAEVGILEVCDGPVAVDWGSTLSAWIKTDIASGAVYTLERTAKSTSSIYNAAYERLGVKRKEDKERIVREIEKMLTSGQLVKVEKYVNRNKKIVLALPAEGLSEVKSQGENEDEEA